MGIPAGDGIAAQAGCGFAGNALVEAKKAGAVRVGLRGREVNRKDAAGRNRRGERAHIGYASCDGMYA